MSTSYQLELQAENIHPFKQPRTVLLVVEETSFNLISEHYLFNCIVQKRNRQQRYEQPKQSVSAQ